MRVVTRREALAVLGSAGIAAAFGCSNSPSTPTPIGGSTSTSTNSSCAVTPSESAGPYPSKTDLFRTDLREDRSGTPLTLKIRVVNVNIACAPVAGVNVGIWHADAAGVYSQYGTASAKTFLRGIQSTDINGEVAFTTIYPGWMQGRATHIYAEVTRNGTSLKVTQIAFPEAINKIVQSQGAYAESGRGTNPVSNAADEAFADSLAAELVTPTGDVTNGYSATFQIAVAL
jgi:protocatechuate 3,4-dioxygenase beta subunit